MLPQLLDLLGNVFASYFLVNASKKWFCDFNSSVKESDGYAITSILLE
jgi:hypothetical protein